MKAALARKNGSRVQTLQFMVDTGDNVCSGTLDLVDGVKRNGEVNIGQLFPIVKAAVGRRLPGVEVHREDIVADV